MPAACGRLLRLRSRPKAADHPEADRLAFGRVPLVATWLAGFPDEPGAGLSLTAYGASGLALRPVRCARARACGMSRASGPPMLRSRPSIAVSTPTLPARFRDASLPPATAGWS